MEAPGEGEGMGGLMDYLNGTTLPTLNGLGVLRIVTAFGP